MEDLLDYCTTELQTRYVEARIRYGSHAEAARRFEVDESTVRKAVKRAQNTKEKVTGIRKEVDAEDLPKILIIDIETAPILAHVWRVWKQNVGHNQVVSDTYIMCFAAKWVGNDDVIYQETRTEDDSEITKTMVKLFDEADYVIAHNAKRFDVPKIKTAAIVHGMPPPSPFKIIDTLVVAKKEFAFTRNTLQHLAEKLGCSPKLDHAKFHGFDLWRECLDGNEEAWQEMMEYNIQDVYTLEEVYMKLRPWHSCHPNLGSKAEHDNPICSKCGSTSLARSGYTYTDVSKFELYRCQECGGYSRGRSSQYPKELRSSLVTTVR